MWSLSRQLLPGRESTATWSHLVYQAGGLTTAVKQQRMLCETTQHSRCTWGWIETCNTNHIHYNMIPDFWRMNIHLPGLWGTPSHVFFCNVDQREKDSVIHMMLNMYDHICIDSPLRWNQFTLQASSIHLRVSWNGGAPKSSIFRFSILNHPAIGVPPWLWKPGWMRLADRWLPSRVLELG